MARYLIEVPHEPEVQACARVVKVFLATGSHLLTHADWGCLDGVHSAWIIVDADSKEEARYVVPPAFRAAARIIGLNKFTIEQIDYIMDHHERSVLAAATDQAPSARLTR
jgi:hypothetical protein